MAEHMRHLWSSDGFMPHGMCYLWQPGILGLHVISDALITLAYFSIPFTLLYFVRKRTDLQFNWMFVCFAIFIVACGTTHLMEIWTVWNPSYWVSGAVKAVTALASVPTAILLARLVPEALRVPSPSALTHANVELEREIAERKRAEEEIRRINEALEARVAARTRELEAMNRSLRESQLLLRAVADNSQAVIYVKDLAGRYLLVNRRFEEIFRIGHEAMLGKTDHDLFAREAADAFRAMDQRVAAAGHALTEEEMVPQEDGPHAYISVKAPLHDATGRPYAVFGVSTDISERKRAEDALRASEERLRLQLERLNLLDWTTRAIGQRQDLHSIFQVVIRSLEERLPIDFGCVCLYDAAQESLTVTCVGSKSEELALELAIPEHAKIRIDENGLARCVRGQLVYESDIASSESPFPQRLARGGLRALVVAPLLVESKAFGVLVAARRQAQAFSSSDCEFLRQLSEHVALAAHQAQLYSALQQAYEDLRQSQQVTLQQERLRALGQMASGIAHDINNAISPAALYVESLLERDASLSAQAREYLATIQRAIEDVAETVLRMREFYRPRDAQPELARVDINGLVQQVVDLTRARWSDMPQQRGIVITLHTDFAVDVPRFPGVESEIRDALTNLIFNAVDAMPKGGALALRTRALAQPGDDGLVISGVVVEVSDTGIGMDEETRRRCLEPFFTTKGERGTGLGLATVYGMVQRHGAELEIESAPRKGTTVRLVFPAAAVDVTSTVHLAGPVLPTGRLRILLVDDDPLLIRSLTDILQSDGHHVTAADGGQAGIDAFVAAQARGERYSVVITDLGMPYVDGRKVAAAIRAASPDTPILLLTGWGQRLMDEDDIPTDVDQVLSKPPKLHELRVALAELTSGGMASEARRAS
jgi:PAS domain S-box-containing protein